MRLGKLIGLALSLLLVAALILPAVAYAAGPPDNPGKPDKHKPVPAINVELAKKCNLQRDIEGFPVQRERGSIINVVSAGGFVLDSVDNLLACLELHQGGAVVFTQLAEGGSHMPDDLGVVLVLSVVEPCRAVAE